MGFSYFPMGRGDSIQLPVPGERVGETQTAR